MEEVFPTLESFAKPRLLAIIQMYRYSDESVFIDIEPNVNK